MSSISSTLEDAALLQMEEDSAALRMELASSWPTAGEVDQMLEKACGAPPGSATELRKIGQLLAVYVTDPHHHYRFPTWQFLSDGRPVPQFAEILGILRELGPYLDENGRTTGWGEVEWFLAPHVLLEDRPPSDLLPHNPQAVLDAALVEYTQE